MTPKEKAKDLINSFYYSLPNNGSETGLNSTTERYKEAIQCALICVDEIIKANHIWYKDSIPYKYWQDVKDELNKQD
jgi:hypothetical protein